MFSLQLSKPLFVNQKIRDYIKESTNKYLEKYLNKPVNYTQKCPLCYNQVMDYDSNAIPNLDKIVPIMQIIKIIPIISFFSFLAGYHFSKLTK
jgi:hypothetical protein